jgi:hypothetical protein
VKSASDPSWESVIPERLMGLPGDLAEIDARLDADAQTAEALNSFEAAVLFWVASS